jgi:glycosyltransferase involved in cell wall biosynthesis
MSGEFKNSVIYGLLRRIDTANCSKADRVVVLSGDMRTAVLSRPGARASVIVVINNFNPTGSTPYSSQDRAPDITPASPLRIIFAGNIGRFQGLETVMDALLLLDDDVDYEMVFVGGGILREHLIRLAGERLGRSIHFVPHQSAEDVSRMILDSDVCLVSLAPEVSKYAYPSKTMTYLAAGRPLLACVEPDSDLGNLIEREEIGLVVPPSEPAALAAAITRLTSEPDLYTQYRSRAAEIGATLFARQPTLDLWSGLITRL